MHKVSACDRLAHGMVMSMLEIPEIGLAHEMVIRAGSGHWYAALEGS
jgi:hypothetical protein